MALQRLERALRGRGAHRAHAWELSRGDPGFPLTAEQLRASAKLVGWLLRELGLPLEAVVPHCSSPTTTHHDCGRDQADGGIWPWEEYVGMVAEALLALS